MRNSIFSDALVSYLGYKTGTSPIEGTERLIAKMGQQFAEKNLPVIQKILQDLNSIKVDWSSATLQEGALKARDEISKKYPNLNSDALDALAWTYSWWWK